MKVKDISNIGVRMQPELREWIKTEAKKNQRSANNEIVFILEKEKALRATNTQGFDANPTNS
jgi:hypothetical protein